MSDEQRPGDEPPRPTRPDGGYPFRLPGEHPHGSDEEETVYDPRPPAGASGGTGSNVPGTGTNAPDAGPGASGGTGTNPDRDTPAEPPDVLWPDASPGADRPPTTTGDSSPAPGGGPPSTHGEPGTGGWSHPAEMRPHNAPGPEDAPVTAVPAGPGFGGHRPPPGMPSAPPVPPVKQPMGAPTPVPPRIGRPTMPYGYTGTVQPGPGGGYQLMLPHIKPIQSGPAIGGILAGCGAILAGIVVGCVGVGFDTVFGVAFAVLAVFLGGTSLSLGLVALRQIRASGGEYTGRGAAITGLVLGSAGLLLTMVMILLVALAAGEPQGPPRPPIGPGHETSAPPGGE